MTEPYVSPHPLPTPAEAELLVFLNEECAEVAQRTTKALRFGLEERQPGQGLSNAARLANELGDLLEVVDLALRAGLISGDDVLAGRLSKRAKLLRYARHARAFLLPAAGP